jgi:hypothetical protein
MIPQTNCRLVSVSRGATQDDFDTAGVAGATFYTADAAGDDAYLSETSRLVPGANTLDRITTAYIIVSGDLPVAWASDDVVTILPDGATVPTTRTVRDVADAPLIGVGTVGTTKLFLHDR